MHTISFALVAQSEIDVIDGSTVRVHGQLIHIIGIDTPKLGQKAHCGLERMLAARATSRLRQIVRRGERIEIDKVACSYRPGTDGSTACNDSKKCGEVKVDGEDAGDILITENLAHPYACGLDECPRPKPWCPFETE
jgi:endonuclease YncB( thermonuclease family)